MDGSSRPSQARQKTFSRTSFSENVLKRLTNLENMKFEKVLIEARVHTVGSFLDTQIVSNRTSALVSTVGWNSTGSNRQKLFLSEKADHPISSKFASHKGCFSLQPEKVSSVTRSKMASHNKYFARQTFAVCTVLH